MGFIDITDGESWNWAGGAAGRNWRVQFDENLEDFFRGKTVVIVAHRLSTVMNADNIIVLEKGEIVEQGTHEELTYAKGAYYQLVRNQLELGA